MPVAMADARDNPNGDQHDIRNVDQGRGTYVPMGPVPGPRLPPRGKAARGYDTGNGGGPVWVLRPRGLPSPFMTMSNTLNGNTISFAYNSNGALSITDTQGRVTTFSYSPQGFITTMTGPTGLKYQYAYNSNGSLTSYTDPAGGVTKYGYDSSDDLTRVTSQQVV